MTKPVLVSGMQPSGRLHIGNYLGALKNLVDLQNSGDYQCYVMVVDLHAITQSFDPKEKHAQIIEVAAEYLAAGLDPKKSVVFQQSQVPAHSELAWILNTVTPIGELERMTQYKDKAERQKENINVGLFDYPVLMAADILLYSPRTIPVGDDQTQHIEFTRTLARKFNSKFGETFIEPKIVLTKTSRVMSLKDPAKKMSKSMPEGCLFLDDSPEEIASKIARAVTDSGSEIAYHPEKQPGLANLIEIYADLAQMEPKTVAAEFSSKSYSDFKKALAHIITEYFAKFRAEKKRLLAKPATIVKVLNEGSAQAAKVAEKKMLEVKEKVGLAL